MCATQAERVIQLTYNSRHAVMILTLILVTCHMHEMHISSLELQRSHELLIQKHPSMSHDFSLSQSQLPPPGALLEVVFDDETGFGDFCLQNGRCFDHFALSKLCFGSHLTETQDGVTQSFYTDVAAELCGDTEELGGQAMGNLILCTHIMNHCMI